MAWREALVTGRKWDQARDTPRFRAAFVTLAQTREMWPQPKHFLDALPRIEQAGIGYEIKQTPPEEAARILARLRREVENAPPLETAAKPEPAVTREEREAAEAELRQRADRKAAAAGPDL